MKVLSERLAARESSLLAVDDGGSEAGFSVGVGEDGSYEIGDDAGRPLPGLLPRIILGSTRAEERVIERLLHLAKFAAVRELDNHDATSELSAALELSLGRLPRGFQKGEKLLPEPFADAADLPTLEAGEYLCLTITNRLEVPLNVAVLDLQPNWAVEQVFPTRRRGDYHSLDGLGRVQIPLRADLPAHLGEGIDVLKVFGTLGPTSFRWLELPSLDAKRSGLPNLESPKTSLEQLFATLTSDLAATRSTRMSQSASDEWCVASREVRVVRRAGEGS